MRRLCGLWLTATLGAVLAAVFLPSVAWAATIYVITGDKRLVQYDSASPGTVVSQHQITGIAPTADVKAIDCRPGTGALYLFTTEGSVGRLYALDPLSGAAALVATLSEPLNGIAFGFDFNPVGGEIRLVTNLEENLRADPVTGSATVATALSYPLGDPGLGANPCLEGAAFTSNTAGATSTTLYGIDTSTNTLVTLDAPDNGVMRTIGTLGVDAAYDFAGFDIGADGTAFAALAVVGTYQSGLYTVDLTTGAVALVGVLGGVTTQDPVVGMTLACGGTTHVTARSLSATRTRRGVTVRWRTATEVDSLGFNVYRETKGKRGRLTAEPIPAQGFGRGSGRTYSYLDRGAATAARYWVEAIALDGSRTWLGPVASREGR